MKKETKIKSAEQALRESLKLGTVWSQETRLSQRILIYMTELMERQNTLLARIARKRK